jgi:hypothetical protein
MFIEPSRTPMSPQRIPRPARDRLTLKRPIIRPSAAEYPRGRPPRLILRMPPMLAMNQCEWTWAEEVHEQCIDAIVFGFVLCAVGMVATELRVISIVSILGDLLPR